MIYTRRTQKFRGTSVQKITVETIRRTDGRTTDITDCLTFSANAVGKTSTGDRPHCRRFDRSIVFASIFKAAHKRVTCHRASSVNWPKMYPINRFSVHFTVRSAVNRPLLKIRSNIKRKIFSTFVTQSR